MSSAKNFDAVARSARERAELAVATGNGAQALEACKLLDELFRAGYALREVAPDEVLEVKPVLMAARYAAKCATCGKQIAVDDFMWWMRTKSQAVDCDACGKAKGYKASAVSR